MFRQVFQADFWHGAALAVLASIDTFCGYTPSQCAPLCAIHSFCPRAFPCSRWHTSS